MTETDPKLVGQWDRITNDACAVEYAAHLRFEPNGVYFGTTEPPGGFTWWDGGTWHATHGRLALSTANDAVISYDYRTIDGQLTITDSSGCRVTYRRQS
jgi:hypothetical protein